MKKLEAIKNLLKKVPELERCFDVGDSYLPVTYVGIEVRNITDVNILDGTVTLELSIFIDFFDVLDEVEYNKSKDDKDYFTTSYYFNPTLNFRNVVSIEENYVPSKHGIRFDSRFQLPDNYCLVRLKSTRRPTVVLKQDCLSLKDYPIDIQSLSIVVEFLTLNKARIKDEMKSRVRNFSVSNTRHCKVKFTVGTLRVKELKAVEIFPCKQTGFAVKFIPFPYWSPHTCSFKDFIVDVSTMRCTYDEDQLQVKMEMYRNSDAFFWQHVLPMLLILFMTLFINSIPSEDVGDRLSILVTLFLTLYAHKYTMMDKIDTTELTNVELVVIFGYVGMFLQGISISTLSEYPDYFMASQVFIVMIIFIVLALYYVFGLHPYMVKVRQIRLDNKSIASEALLDICTDEFKGTYLKHNDKMTYVPFEMPFSNAAKIEDGGIHHQVRKGLAETSELISAFNLREKDLLDSILKKLDSFVFQELDEEKNILKQLEGFNFTTYDDEYNQYLTEGHCAATDDLAKWFNSIHGRYSSEIEWDSIIHMKEPFHARVKCELRRKILNDKYRLILYYDANKISAILDLVRDICEKSKTYCFDMNITSQVHIRMLKLYSFVDGKYLLEIAFQNLENIEDFHKLHDVYSFARLIPTLKLPYLISNASTDNECKCSTGEDVRRKSYKAAQKIVQFYRNHNRKISCRNERRQFKISGSSVAAKNVKKDFESTRRDKL